MPSGGAAAVTLDCGETRESRSCSQVNGSSPRARQAALSSLAGVSLCGDRRHHGPSFFRPGKTHRWEQFFVIHSSRTVTRSAGIGRRRSLPFRG